MGELEFKDFYWQIKWRLETDMDKYKLGHLCIRTAMGTLCYSQALMGLLGMDVFQDELTDRLFGDLFLAGYLVKLADNVYFGGDTVQEFTDILAIVLERCLMADLRVKPVKLRLNIRSADILGLHWCSGTLSPSKHKLEPLAHCDPPRTVKGLRGFLGGVRWHEICLPGPQLAQVTKPMDEEVPASRSGREEIVWTDQLREAFARTQEILGNPLIVTVPQQGDTPYIATDACTSLPAGGTKLFLKHPGVPGFLPSFNFGCRLPSGFKTWPPHDIEAFFLSKGIEKASHYIRICETPGVALVDSKPTYQAKQRLDKGLFSTSRRMQDLLPICRPRECRSSR